MTDSTARFGRAPTGGFYFFGGVTAVGRDQACEVLKTSEVLASRQNIPFGWITGSRARVNRSITGYMEKENANCNN